MTSKSAVHILGIAGTFMGGLAQIAKAAGFRVSGADRQVYSPMREQLEAAEIPWQEGYAPEQLDDLPAEAEIVTRSHLALYDLGRRAEEDDLVA